MPSIILNVKVHDIDPTQLIEPEPEQSRESILRKVLHVGKEVVQEFVQLIGNADTIEATRNSAHHL